MPKGFKPLSGLDALFLYLESSGNPMHTGSLIVLKPMQGKKLPDAESLRRHLIARLKPLGLLRRVLVEAPLGLGHPVWREGARIDFDEHVVVRRLRKPGSDAVLSSTIAAWHAEPMDRDRPMWEAVVIEGLQGGRLALYLRSHHALLDGQAGVKVTSALVDLEAVSMSSSDVDEDDAALSKRGARRAALRLSARQLSDWWREAPDLIRQISRKVQETTLSSLRASLWTAPRTRFNRNIGDERSVAFASLPMSEVKRLGAAYGGSLNDGVMILVSDALREWLKRRDELPDKPLIAAMPVSVRAEGSQAGNEVSMVQCPLATDEPNRRDRGKAIVEATRAIKGRVSAFKDLIPTDFPGLAAPLWVSGLSRLWQRGKLSEKLPPLANLIVSNVPGVPVPLFLGGMRIEHFYPVSIVTHGLGLNITLVSYAGSMELGVVTAKELCDRPDVLLRGMQRALKARSKEYADGGQA